MGGNPQYSYIGSVNAMRWRQLSTSAVATCSARCPGTSIRARLSPVARRTGGGRRHLWLAALASTMILNLLFFFFTKEQSTPADGFCRPEPGKAGLFQLPPQLSVLPPFCAQHWAKVTAGLALLLTYSLAALTTWGAAYTILGQVALPGTVPITVTLRGGTVFALLALLGCSWPAGWLVQQAGLPPLLGMLLTGIVLTNVPYIDVARGLDPSWSSAVRSTALAVILLRAGLGLDPGARFCQ